MGIFERFEERFKAEARQHVERIHEEYCQVSWRDRVKTNGKSGSPVGYRAIVPLSLMFVEVSDYPIFNHATFLGPKRYTGLKGFMHRHRLNAALALRPNAPEWMNGRRAKSIASSGGTAPFSRLIYLFCNRAGPAPGEGQPEQRIPLPITLGDGSLKYLTEFDEFISMLFEREIALLEEHGVELAQYSLNCGAETSDFCMGTVFYIVVRDGNPAGTELAQQMTEKLADYLEQSIDLIRSELLRNYSRVNEKLIRDMRPCQEFREFSDGLVGGGLKARQDAG